MIFHQLKLSTHIWSNSMAKVRCVNPSHRDDTPSMEVYAEGAYCFSCGYSTHDVTGDYTPKPKTDIGAEIEYIKSLPKRGFRGLEFHFDKEGFYILWPDLAFYKKRIFEGTNRYVGPTGHRPPPFKIPGTDTKNLILVEGEINALSLSVSVGNLYTIASYGAASNYSICIPLCLIYHSIFVIVDKDIAGVDSGIKLKNQLLKWGKTVHLIATERDVNQILQYGDKKAVREFWDNQVGLPREM